jgi:hypothetical protein
MRSAVLAAGLAVAVVLSGCASPADDYGQGTAERLQAAVLQVTDAAASGDFTEALTSVAELEVTLADARARGDVTEERFESISAAIALVRTDLEAAIAAEAPEPEQPAGVDDPGEDNSGPGKNGKGPKDDKGKKGKPKDDKKGQG